MGEKTFQLVVLCLLVTTLTGCAVVTQTSSQVYVRGQVTDGSGRVQSERRTSIAIDRTTVAVDDDGRFTYQFSYAHGRLLLILPPLGNFPRKTPPPPEVRISFPEKPEAYYIITADRERVSWELITDSSDEVKERNVTIPSLLNAHLEEYNKRDEGKNDWLLRLELTY